MCTLSLLEVFPFALGKCFNEERDELGHLVLPFALRSPHIFEPHMAEVRARQTGTVRSEVCVAMLLGAASVTSGSQAQPARCSIYSRRGSRMA